MKQQIICPECIKKYPHLFSNSNPYPREHTKVMNGKARDNFKCDFCGEKIEIGSDCIAHSIWADYGGQPYYEWETKFVG